MLWLHNSWILWPVGLVVSVEAHKPPKHDFQVIFPENSPGEEASLHAKSKRSFSGFSDMLDTATQQSKKRNFNSNLENFYINWKNNFLKNMNSKRSFIDNFEDILDGETGGKKKKRNFIDNFEDILDGESGGKKKKKRNFLDNFEDLLDDQSGGEMKKRNHQKTNSNPDFNILTDDTGRGLKLDDLDLDYLYKELGYRKRSGGNVEPDFEDEDAADDDGEEESHMFRKRSSENKLYVDDHLNKKLDGYEKHLAQLNRLKNLDFQSHNHGDRMLSNLKKRGGLSDAHGDGNMGALSVDEELMALILISSDLLERYGV